MASDTNIKQLDRRTQARYLQRGQLSEKDLEKHLKGLPDVSANSVKIETEQPSGGSAPTR